MDVHAGKAANIDRERTFRDNIRDQVNEADGLWISAHSDHEVVDDLAGQHRMLQMNALDNTEVIVDIAEMNLLVVMHKGHEHV